MWGGGGEGGTFQRRRAFLVLDPKHQVRLSKVLLHQITYIFSVFRR